MDIPGISKATIGGWSLRVSSTGFSMKESDDKKSDVWIPLSTVWFSLEEARELCQFLTEHLPNQAEIAEVENEEDEEKLEGTPATFLYKIREEG